MTLNSAIEIHAVNELSLHLKCHHPITPELAQHLANLCKDLAAHYPHTLIDAVPSYNSILLTFDTSKESIFYFKQHVQELIAHYPFLEQEQQQRRILRIPVYYHTDVGPDLRKIAEHSGLSIEDIIQLHCERTYTVYSLGFAPGFAYMGNVDERIALPRLATPRERVAKGSVGIAGKQTGIYPQSLPGGWNIIGQTPCDLFHLDGNVVVCPFSAGCRVRFFAINREEFVDFTDKPFDLENAP